MDGRLTCPLARGLPECVARTPSMLHAVGRRFNDCVAASPRPCQRYLLPLQPLPSHINVCIIDRWKSELQTKTTQFLRRSITELCQVDHGDDPAVVANWLQNKTPDNVRSWISHPASYVIVATDTTRIIGVGAITSSSEITLNYVSPDARFRGISKAILQRLEARGRVLGNTTCTLTSTETAYRFYRSAGYVQHGPPAAGIGRGSSYRMVKHLDH
jgi:GNAT superfamily N-acetyltransferase